MNEYWAAVNHARSSERMGAYDIMVLLVCRRCSTNYYINLGPQAHQSSHRNSPQYPLTEELEQEAKSTTRTKEGLPKDRHALIEPMLLRCVHGIPSPVAKDMTVLIPVFLSSPKLPKDQLYSSFFHVSGVLNL